MNFCNICNNNYGKCTDCNKKCTYLVFPYAVGPHCFEYVTNIKKFMRPDLLKEIYIFIIQMGKRNY